MSSLRTYNTKTEMVYEKLKEDIVAGILKQGEKIIAREVATEFGVSDIPVREALKKLESNGLVENVPHVGSRVTEVNIKTANEIFMIRVELESFATRLAAKNANASEAKKLQEIVDDIDLCIQRDDIEELSRLNTHFHKTLYKLSRNETLCDLIFSLMDRSQYSRSVFTYIPDRKEHSNEEHKLIVDAISKGDTEEAEKALRTQKEIAFAAFLNKLKTEEKA